MDAPHDHQHHRDSDASSACCHQREEPSVTALPGAKWTCPMHPEIVRDKPGSCPICGMALEPMTPSTTEAPNPELTSMTRRLWIGLVFAAPVFALEMSAHVPAFSHIIPHDVSAWIQFVLATPVVAWGGWPFFERGYASLVSRNLNMFTLIAMGVGVAYAYSFVALVAPSVFPYATDHMDGPPVYFEAAAVITVLALLGQVLELRARESTSGAIRALLDLAPKTARRIRADGGDEDVPLDQVRIGDRLRVRPGEKIPVDGEILEGRVAVDESLITGESMPVTKAPGAKVVGGALNKTGAFVMRAEKIGADTLLSQIVQLVAAAQRSRAPIQRLADHVAGYFVPAVIAVSVIAFCAWLIWGPEPRFSYALLAAVSVLIIACPCALGLATPMSIMVGIGRGAEAGVLIKNAEALERFEKIDTLVVDKTGTLTEGRPAVIALKPAKGIEEDELLRIAASVERNSEHPLADAIVRIAGDRKLSLAQVENFDSPVGKGVEGTLDGKTVVIGGPAIMRERGVDVSQMQIDAEALRRDGATAIFVGVDGAPAGLIGVADPIKRNTREAVQALSADGIRLVMLTGDNRTTAQAIANRLGITEIEAGVLPQQKAEIAQRLRKEGRIVAMAGDGVNDAPALAAADVGVAMGAGADVAIESAGVTLLNGDLTGLMRARHLSRAVMRNIRQNLFFAFAYNVAGVPIAAGLFYPLFGWTLSPAIAAGAMALSSVSVIGNALRLRGVRLQSRRQT